jgi:hypothetical protein
MEAADSMEVMDSTAAGAFTEGADSMAAGTEAAMEGIGNEFEL